jgi:signal peptidase I
MLKHVNRHISAQRDILSADEIQKITTARDDLQGAIRNNQPKKDLRIKMDNMETAANKHFRPYPAAAWRENVEVLLVAIAVAMGIRTFFVQPFKIPTGSMQPTLYGITSTPDYTPRVSTPEPETQPDFEVPNPIVRFLKFWYSGVSYTHIKARRDSRVRDILPPKRFLLFNLHQRFYMETPSGEVDAYNVWFPPDGLFLRAGLIRQHGYMSGYNSRVFKAGEDIMKIKVISGDHLFVDRMTYNFRRPKLGEIIVFETRDVHPLLPPDQFYIKRMVAMGNNKVQIGDDRHLRIDGKRLDTNTPHFERVYSFPPDRPPMDSVYSGHLNETIARKYGMSLAPKFDTENEVFTVRPDHYIVMGDNTVNSSDSRSWGDFPQRNVIGKSFLVYWPFGPQDGRKSRFGWGNR